MVVITEVCHFNLGLTLLLLVIFIRSLIDEGLGFDSIFRIGLAEL